MVKMQPYVKMFYDYLAEGKIMGLKCNKCGSIEFPPVTVCNNCSGTDLSWVEMSGEGTLVSFTTSIYAQPPFAQYAPYLYGTVILKEGARFPGMILGVTADQEQELFDQLPISVKAEVMERDGYNAVAFRVKL
jgi:hypothetical protein